MNGTKEKIQEILNFFSQISQIPRCSKNEEKVIQFLLDWAGRHNFSSERDNIGNIVIRVPATRGYEKSPAVVLQGHMDMVCEKTPDSTHDFSRDPITLLYEGDWLRADKTTLGADNGIGIAMAMTAAVASDIQHPPLELLFTVDEEQGLGGAVFLNPGFIQGKILLNLDSEDEGVFTVGCAGGRDTHITLPLKREPIPNGFSVFTVKAGGMTGGHSGVNINEERGNAVIVLARILFPLVKELGLSLISFSGGTAHNAIPRDAAAVVAIPSAAETRLKQQVQEWETKIRNEFKNTDPGFTLSLSRETDANNAALSNRSTTKVLRLLLALPHGTAAMSTEMKGLVETSSNLAKVNIEEKNLKIVTSQRSSVMSRLQAITQKVEVIARMSGAKVKSSQGYPSWQPNLQSPLLDRCKSLYRKLFAKEAVVESIHAGLECGIIGDKFPGMDMISIGPTIKNPHSPAEKVHVESIGQVWDLLKSILASYC